MRSVATSVLMLLVGCADADPVRDVAVKPEAREPYNVVLIVMDTVRADHIGAYGYDRPTSPNVDAVARHATLYENAMSTAPWTLPSHASMFTGKAPHEHGAHTFHVDERVNNVASLPEDVPVIAEAFAELGYATAGFAANDVFCKPRWGLDRGFETYVSRHGYAPVHNRRVFEWLRESAREPFFLFVNYIDAHRPYNVSPRPGVVPEPIDGDAFLIDRLKRSVMGTDEPLPEDLAERVIAQYDTAVAHIDEGIGDLVRELDRLGLRDETILVITSDHGEYFGEHDMVEHNMDVYQPGVRVPLIVDSPGEEGGVVDTPVTSQDIPWLIASRMTNKRARQALAPFAGEGPTGHPVLVENYYSRLWDVFSDVWGHRFRRVRRGLYDWPYKLIHSSDGEHELFDLSKDPDERVDLSERQPDRVREMVRQVEAETGRNADRAGAPETSLTEAEIERMRALGYVE